jgi:ribosomal protein S18 acetylase RimI-like enzyme
MISYIEARSPSEIKEEKKLFTEYAEWLGCSPCAQNIEKELADLPGIYSPPEGRLILAIDDEKFVGTVALRKMNDDLCEMRRLYVRPEYRGRSIGKGLAETIINKAREIGYKRIRLYTLDTMKEAIGIYTSLGFREIDFYIDDAIDNAHFMELDL